MPRVECDDCNKDADVGYCRKCYDKIIEEEKEKFYDEGYEAGKSDAETEAAQEAMGIAEQEN